MREVKRSALVAQPASAMFALINDIESYPQFVPGVTHARVESRGDREIVATLGVKRGAMKAEFTTRNILEPDSRIVMKRVRGPFRELEGVWQLTPIGAQGCKVELSLRYEFSSRLLEKLIGPVFGYIANSMVDAFVKRAQTLYG